MGKKAAVRVLFAAAREGSYARNEVLLRALRRFAEVDVLAPEEPRASLVRTSAQVAGRALGRLAARRYDLLFVGFYGSLLAPLRVAARAPLLLDAFVSNYDTLAFDRGAFAPGSLRGRMALALDRASCALADHVLLDTEAHVDYFAEAIGVPRARMSALPVGCNEQIFFPTPQPQAGVTQVLSYCTYMPLHGVDTILHAASLLASQAICFRLIGEGPLLPEMRALAQALRLERVEFLPSVPPVEIAAELRAAHICLGGHFGGSAKAQRTVPGKVYQMLAAERAVVAADSVANRALLQGGRDALLVPPANPAALAEAILALHTEPALRARIARGGRAAFTAQASEAVITERLHALATRTVARAENKQP